MTSGTNGTIQIQSNGHNGGGLYGCVDVTFSSSASTSACAPNSNIQIGAAEVSGHPNGTSYGAQASDSPAVSSTGAAAGGPSQTGTAPATSSTAPSAAGIVSVGVSSLVLGVFGAMALNL